MSTLKLCEAHTPVTWIHIKHIHTFTTSTESVIIFLLPSLLSFLTRRPDSCGQTPPCSPRCCGHTLGDRSARSPPPEPPPRRTRTPPSPTSHLRTDRDVGNTSEYLRWSEAGSFIGHLVGLVKDKWVINPLMPCCLQPVLDF